MGGDRVSALISSTDEESSLEQESREYPFELPTLLRGDGLSSEIEDGSVNADKDLVFGKFDDVGSQLSSNSLIFKVNQRRARSVYSEVLRSYDELQCRAESLEEAKRIILSYNAGAWTEKVGGMKLSDYNVPSTTSLLLIGPERSGKSSLVNRISRVFDDDKFAPERAQVSYDPYVEDGTYFLHEYMIPRGSTSFCLYDTRSLSNNASGNMDILRHWMTEGVRHGELVSRNSDDPSLKTRLKCKAHENRYCPSKIRMVNFVIFVVSGFSVLNSVECDEEAEDGYNKMIATMFNCPFLSFRGNIRFVQKHKKKLDHVQLDILQRNKVLSERTHHICASRLDIHDQRNKMINLLLSSHGDLLSLSDRAHVRVHLGKLLGIPPKKQIFDIPDNCDPVTELTIIDLIRYSLEHADKNLPSRRRFMDKVFKAPQRISLLLVLILSIAIVSALVRDAYFYSGHTHHAPQTDTPIDWNSIRYLWLGQEYA